MARSSKKGGIWATIETRLAKDVMAREPQWTESIAVGSRAFVEAIGREVTGRQQLEYATVGGDAWALREDAPPLFRQTTDG